MFLCASGYEVAAINLCDDIEKQLTCIVRDIIVGVPQNEWKLLPKVIIGVFGCELISKGTEETYFLLGFA